MKSPLNGGPGLIGYGYCARLAAVLEIVGGLVLFVLAWVLLQAVLVFFSWIFHSISDSYYSAKRWSKVVNRRESERLAKKP
jgi:fatty acid desaturase